MRLVVEARMVFLGTWLDFYTTLHPLQHIKGHKKGRKARGHARREILTQG